MVVLRVAYDELCRHTRDKQIRFSHLTIYSLIFPNQTKTKIRTIEAQNANLLVLQEQKNHFFKNYNRQCIITVNTNSQYFRLLKSKVYLVLRKSIYNGSFKFCFGKIFLILLKRESAKNAKKDALER